MTLDPTTDQGRPIVTYVRVGRGMVKVTKYENEQPKSPSDTASLRSSHSSSGRSNSTPGPSRSWLRRPRIHKTPSKRAPSAHRSRSRSSGRSLQTVRRAGGYMHSDADLTSAERRSSHDGATSPSRRGRAEPQGLFALNNFPAPARHGEQSYDHHDHRHHSSPAHLPESRGRELRISPLSTSPTQQSHSGSAAPSPNTQSWATDSEADPLADTEMWSSISRLEDELVSRFGRGVVPPLTALRQEKTSGPPPPSRIRTPSLPDEHAATTQRQLHTQSQNAKLLQRFHEPINPAALPRQVHRTKSTPTLTFPLPPATFPSWVTNTPLPTPPGGPFPESQHSQVSSSALLRAKAGPAPPFAPPPNFPPPPAPTIRPEDRDTQRDLDALVALYEVLEAGYRAGTVGGARPRSTIGRSGGLRKPGEAGAIARDSCAPGPRRKVSSGTKPFEGRSEDVLEEEEGDVISSGLVAQAY